MHPFPNDSCLLLTLKLHQEMVATYLFACVHNAGRSQMAAAWFNHLVDPSEAQAISAGTQPDDHVHPEVLKAMAEINIDLSGATPRKLTDELARGVTLLVTMGCGMRLLLLCCAVISRYSSLFLQKRRPSQCLRHVIICLPARRWLQTHLVYVRRRVQSKHSRATHGRLACGKSQRQTRGDST